MAISDTAARAAKARDKDYKVSDEKGLFLLVKKTGSKYWRMKYRFAGKEKKLSIGVYPETSLAEARRARDEARSLLAKGIDPSALRKTKKIRGKQEAQNTFTALADEWYEKQRPTWAEATAKKRRALIDNDMIPWLGNTPINKIDTHDLLAVLQRIEDRGAINTAHNARQVFNQVFRYAKQTRRVKENPALDLAGAIRPDTTQHRPAITDPVEFGKLLNKIDRYQGTFIIRCMLKLFPLLFQRPGEVVSMKWEEIDLEAAEWRFYVTKTKQSHIVPLAQAAVEILTELKALTGNREHVFPGARNPRTHTTTAAVNAALRKMGYDTKKDHCAHGFRASARTLLDEQMNFRLEWIEQQLAHQVRDSLGRAYNRTKHLPQRTQMMEQWASYLDTLRLGADNVVPITSAKR